MLGSRVFHSPWRARARSFDSTLSFIICVVCVCIMCIYNESVVPQFSLRDKRNDSEKARARLKKSFWTISLLFVRALLLPKTAFEKKNRIFFFLILSCVQHFLPLRWLFLLCRLLSPPPRFAVIIIIIIIKTERRQKEEEKEDDSMLKAHVKKEEDARDLHERGRDAKMMMMLMMISKKVVIIISRTERCSK